MSEFPEIIEIYGSGRAPSTRGARRAARFQRKAFRIAGTYLVRPGRRFTMRFERLLQHSEEILGYMRSGQLEVQYRGRTVPIEAIEAAVNSTETEPAPEEPEGELSEATDPEPEEDTEETGEPEEPEGSGLVMTEVEGDPGPPSETEPEEAAEEPEEPSEFLALPDGWEDAVKADLLRFHEERDIPVPEDTRNASLVDSLRTWLDRQG